MKAILIINKNNKVVNTLEFEDLKASLQLSKVLIWKHNDKSNVKIWELINPSGTHEIRAQVRINYNDIEREFIYNYRFIGEEIEDLPRYLEIQ